MSPHDGLKISAACLLLAMGGCASGNQQQQTAQPRPAVAMTEIKTILMSSRSVWKDPDSIRDTRIGQPYNTGCWGAVEHIASAIDTCVCIATNAKNSFGGYTGLQPQIALISGRQVVDLIKPRMHDQCGGLVSWPEFDGKGR